MTGDKKSDHVAESESFANVEILNFIQVGLEVPRGNTVCLDGYCASQCKVEVKFVAIQNVECEREEAS